MCKDTVVSFHDFDRLLLHWNLCSSFFTVVPMMSYKFCWLLDDRLYELWCDEWFSSYMILALASFARIYHFKISKRNSLSFRNFSKNSDAEFRSLGSSSHYVYRAALRLERIRNWLVKTGLYLFWTSYLFLIFTSVL